ncbi:hypothetical protein [Streptomyces sviceus]|uniref:hypothetical protein n=1 Tax=Streptomyces sviceus TaxID=285530 RepID=UPI0036EFE436
MTAWPTEHIAAHGGVGILAAVLLPALEGQDAGAAPGTAVRAPPFVLIGYVIRPAGPG